MTQWIAPDCPPELEEHIRREAAARGEDVMPRKTFPWNRKAADEKAVADRRWRSGSKAKAPQKPCDIGLFSDASAQIDLIDYLNQHPAKDANR